MILEFKQREEDIIAFNYFFFWSSPERKGLRILVRTAPLFVFSIISYLMNPNYNDWTAVNWFLIALGIAFIFFAPFYVKNRLKKRLHKILLRAKKKNVFGVRTISIDDDHIQAKDDLATNNLEWSAVQKFVEIENYFFMFFSTNSTLIFPKRVFKTESEMDDLFEMVNRKIN